LDVDYERAFPGSGIFRIRRGATDATIITHNPTFFTLHKGNAVLQSLRLSAAFFGRGQFVAQSSEQRNGKYILRWYLKRPYYQLFPVDELPGDGDWNKMPRGRRPQSEVQELTMNVTIEEKNATFRIHFDLQGTDNVPVNLEMGFRKGGAFSNVEPVMDIEGAHLLREGMGQYYFDGKTIDFGPGQAEHRWTELRGALPKPDLDCVYITGYSPFVKTITIK
jgi:hypothetical protein